ncbi:MAG: hypothetical protein IPM51_17305 [Sphingobacteriaceae bacterium]|nr:hypothetical protein [Sphingobacteriaceae bacterium]
MVRNILQIIIFLSIILSCKKKSKDSEPEPTPAATTTGGQPASTYHGMFEAEKYLYWWGGNSIVSFYQCKCWLNASGKTEVLLNSYGENLGIVQSNSLQLKYDGTLKMYMDSTSTLSYSNVISFQHNSNALGNINFTNQDTFPRFLPSLAQNLNDTVYKNQNYSVPLNGLTYFNEITAIFSSTVNLFVYVGKTVSFGASEVLFTPNELSALPSNSPGMLRIVLRKFNYQNLNGKNYRFAAVSMNDFVIYIK